MVRGSPIICSSKTNSLGDDLVVGMLLYLRRFLFSIPGAKY